MQTPNNAPTLVATPAPDGKPGWLMLTLNLPGGQCSSAGPVDPINYWPAAASLGFWASRHLPRLETLAVNVDALNIKSDFFAQNLARQLGRALAEGFEQAQDPSHPLNNL
ncbi:hypothetical protein [Cupriavidus oxalaticus]|uniref:Uncharacterized protein n=1 Tax=Cupriavidus oxalaticus TaxID=96344 RepID=A0A5P3VH37_9BURK|nr:hypothetical protein [Cupriavidus oxalaticus]QEZ44723.1 hypothetical protein D2917_11075 [Cupriavidus oxalaticus]